MKPVVSIITPMYNNEAVIKKTIESVINQTYTYWELLLIDDASSDKTVDMVREFVDSNSKIRLIQQAQNMGASEARNLGTKMSNGEYIAFLDADDLWEKGKLEQQIKILNDNLADVVFGSYELIDSKGKPLKKKVNALRILSFKKQLKANYIGNLTGMYNCTKLGKIYTKNLRKRQDWLLWLEALKRSEKPAIGISESIAYYRISDKSLSSNKLNLIKYNFNVYRKGLGFSYLKSLVYLFIFLKEHFIIKQRLIKPIF